MNWKKLLHLFHRQRAKGRFVGRMRTHDDTSLTFRMRAGFAGVVTRLMGANIEPNFADQTNPPTLFGQPVVVDGTSNQVRAMLVGDNALTSIYGLTVRPHPFQQAQAATDYAPAAIGAGTPPKSQVMDVLRRGYMLVPLNVTGAVKGGRVYIWAVATSGAHILGGFEVAPSANKTILLDEKSYYNGVEDANKLVEIGFNL